MRSKSRGVNSAAESGACRCSRVTDGAATYDANLQQGRLTGDTGRSLEYFAAMDVSRHRDPYDGLPFNKHLTTTGDAETIYQSGDASESTRKPKYPLKTQKTEEPSQGPHATLKGSAISNSKRDSTVTLNNPDDEESYFLANSPDEALKTAQGCPKKVATGNSLADKHDGERSGHRATTLPRTNSPLESSVVEGKRDQDTLDTGNAFGTALTGYTTSPSHPNYPGTDFVSRLTQHQRNQYAPFRETRITDSRPRTLQMKRSRQQPPTTRKDAPPSKRLRQTVERRLARSSHPPPVDSDDEQYLVELVLARRVQKRAGKHATQFLIRWLGYEEDEDCWVDERDIHPDLIEQFRTRERQGGERGGEAGEQEPGKSAALAAEREYRSISLLEARAAF